MTGFKEFEKDYEPQERELLVLMSDESGGGSGSMPYVVASAYFLAYVDVATGELVVGDGRIVWPVEGIEAKKFAYFDRFKKGTIYRIRGRRLIPPAVTENLRADYLNNFYVTEVLEEGAKCAVLEPILTQYRKPVVLQDEVLGELKLDKSLGLFEGHTIWQGKKIVIFLDVDKENKSSWTRARNALKKMVAEQSKWDAQMRQFAARELTELANQWQDDDDDKGPDAPEITEADFAQRISLSELSMTAGGSFDAYFDDDDLFWGHAIEVSGTLKKGVQSADIQG